MKSRTGDVVVGIFVILGALAFLFLALKVSGLTSLSDNGGYLLKANFNNVGDLKVRAPVTLAGVKVGNVESIGLNAKTYQATVTLKIMPNIKLPGGTTASIFTEGLLGNNYISLTPGYEESNLKPGALITDTHSAIILENLIGQLIFNNSKKK